LCSTLSRAGLLALEAGERGNETLLLVLN
jgi:hypothetical protein